MTDRYLELDDRQPLPPLQKRITDKSKLCCKFCLFYFSNQRECRANPPTVVVVREGSVSAYPYVDENNFCRLFELKENG